MTALIGVALLLLLGFYIYRGVRLVLGESSTHNPVLARLARSLDTDVPDTPAEAREGELTRQLLAGSIDSGFYQQQLSELAQQSHTHTGDPR